MVLFDMLWFDVMVHSTFCRTIPPLKKPQMQLGDLGEHCKVTQRGSGHSPGRKRILIYFEPVKPVWWHFGSLCADQNVVTEANLALGIFQGGGASVHLARACWRPCVNMPIYNALKRWRKQELNSNISAGCMYGLVRLLFPWTLTPYSCLNT